MSIEKATHYLPQLYCSATARQPSQVIQPRPLRGGLIDGRREAFGEAGAFGLISPPA